MNALGAETGTIRTFGKSGTAKAGRQNGPAKARFALFSNQAQVCLYLAYRLQAGAGISGRTKHPRHSGGGALAGLAHYMLGWPGGGSRCADAPVYLLHSRTLPSPSQRLPLPWPKVFQGCARYDDSSSTICSSIQTHLYCKN